jgi:hypothetical protein
MPTDYALLDGAGERTDQEVRESERELRLIVQSLAAMI